MTLRVHNPFSPSEVTHEYSTTSAAELDALLRGPFAPATVAQLHAFVRTVTAGTLKQVLQESFAWPTQYADEELARIRAVLQWHLDNVQPHGRPLGSGTIQPHETDPLAALIHLTVALLTGNQVLLAPTAQAASFATFVTKHAQEASLPVHAVYVAPEAAAAYFAHPAQAFVTWWGNSFAGFELAGEVSQLAPGQVTPRRIWGQFDGNGVAIICEDADVQLAAKQVARFAFSPVVASSLGIERVVAADAVHDEFVTALAAAAEYAHQYTPATTALAERFAQFRQLAQIEGHVVRDEDNGVIATDVPSSATTACEVVQGPLVITHRARSTEELISFAGGGLYGSVAAVFGGDSEFVQKVTTANIAGTVFHNALRHPAPHESAPVAKLSGIQTFPLGPELHRNYERAVTVLPDEQ